MRYDWGDPLGLKIDSAEFFAEIDRRFFGTAAGFMPWTARPFDALIDFAKLPRQDVLEIGVGAGSHAQLIAPLAKSFTGIDLTAAAIQSANTRFELAGIRNARLLRMDAEAMTFPSESFDFIWSWGVIHHSANTRRILQEIARVLRRGGRAVTMVYHRNVWNWYVVGGLIHGVLQGGFMRHRSLHGVVQSKTDGALARYYTPAEWKTLVGELLVVERMSIYGSKAEMIPIPGSAFKRKLLQLIPDRVARLLTNRWGLGSFLVAEMRKRD